MNISWKEIYNRVNKLDLFKKYYGVPRGGSVIAGLTGNAVDNIDDADIIIDDLIDSGKTRDRYKELYPNKPFIALFNKQIEKLSWITFPYEIETASEIEDNVLRLLQYFDNDNLREGLKDTPRRYVKFLREFLQPQEFNYTVFDSEGYEGIISQKNIEFYSLCEHHLAPFFGVCHIGYIPNEHIVGLSKLARTVELYSRKFQNQERMTNQIAHALNGKLNAKGVIVITNAQHLCMSMRGVKKSTANTTCISKLGVFENDKELFNEFLSTIK